MTTIIYSFSRLNLVYKMSSRYWSGVFQKRIDFEYSYIKQASLALKVIGEIETRIHRLSRVWKSWCPKLFSSTTWFHRSLSSFAYDKSGSICHSAIYSWTHLNILVKKKFFLLIFWDDMAFLKLMFLKFVNEINTW